MNAPTPTYALPHELSHLKARAAFRSLGGATPSRQATEAQIRYADDVNSFGAELLAEGHDRKAVDQQIERYAKNYVDRIGKWLSAVAKGAPDADERLEAFDKWHADARAATRANLAAAVGQFEPIIEKPDLSILVNKEAGRARVQFVERPEPEVRDGLKAIGWKWQTGPQAWEAPIDQVDAVRELLGLGRHQAHENGRRAAASAKRGRA